MLLQQPSIPPQDKVKWEQIHGILEDLGKDGQSTEESDAEREDLLHVTVPHYRCRIVGHIMSDLDEQI
jgi:phenylalanyl-tRNA synthetase beta subunit